MMQDGFEKGIDMTLVTRIRRSSRGLLGMCAALAILEGCSGAGSPKAGLPLAGSSAQSIGAVRTGSQNASDIRRITEFLQSRGLLQPLALEQSGASTTCRSEGERC